MSTHPNFATAILKLTSFCNLNCSYCYMFNLADQTHARVADHMPAETAVRAVESLAAHVRAHAGRRMDVVLHGGEPTLWPLESFRRLFDAVSRVRASGLPVDVSLQTNGLRLRRGLVELLEAEQVSLGFSLDGPAEENDRYRVTHAGGGSYARVVESIGRALEWGMNRRRVGVLSVVNPGVEPARFMEWAAGLPVRNLNVLWPIEFSWENPPWGRGEMSEYEREPVYGRWMAAAFRLWWEHYVERLHVGNFVETISRLMGSRSHSDSIGNDFINMFVVNTDGCIEYPDYLRAHRDGGSRTNFFVGRTELDELSRDETFRALLHLREHLPAECVACVNNDVCGGGFIAGRAGAGGFDVARRSVLCFDQFHYFNSVREIIAPYLRRLEEAEARGGAAVPVVKPR